MNSIKIAVVGSGISGLSAAWLLSQRHTVTLIEAENRLGGHSNTVDCKTKEGLVPIDTGFIVYNCATYPNLVALFDYLNVPTARSNMGFSVSLNGGASEYAGDSLLQMFGNAGNLVSLQHWRMLWDITRFFRTALGQSRHLPQNVTLGQFFKDQSYSRAFMDRHLLPMAGAIWSSEPHHMIDFPARSFLRFFDNHGLLRFTNRPQWRTVVGGSRAYVERLTADGRFETRLGCRVHKIDRLAKGVVVHGSEGFRQEFDQVVIATHADQALAMLGTPFARERKFLRAFRYARNRAVLHRDRALMPRRSRLWSSWNYATENADPHQPSSVTYWMNALQPLATSTDFFVSLNPRREPAADLTEREFSYDHPMFTSETAKLQESMWCLQGQHRTWYCGAHFGVGFHEDGLQAGLAVAEQLGDVMRPWNLPNPSSRINVARPYTVLETAPLEAAE